MASRVCSIAGCGKAHQARGWCWKHYQKWRKYGDPLAGFVAPTCKAAGCATPARSGGYCDMHYTRWKRHGDPGVRLTVPWGVCSVDGCDLQAFGRGLCQRHHRLTWLSEGGQAKEAAARARRRAAVAGSPVRDRGLSWVALWSDGHRACYLCGGECDPADFRTIVNRAGRKQKISGPTYPSLDHVMPLSKGGHHSRSNVALACLRCNLRKHAALPRGEAA